jgi:hypothetical protein
VFLGCSISLVQVAKIQGIADDTCALQSPEVVNRKQLSAHEDAKLLRDLESSFREAVRSSVHYKSTSSSLSAHISTGSVSGALGARNLLAYSTNPSCSQSLYQQRTAAPKLNPRWHRYLVVLLPRAFQAGALWEAQTQT